ncbi:putative DNA/RNA polymerase superfamily [Helianthus annuus]|nr:putative DNA/RNA polymerase superfamily [Helianthus annuus]
MGETVFPLGQITFQVTLTDSKYTRTEEVNFMVLPHASKHDVLPNRETQGDFNLITSTPHSAIGFSTETGIAILYARQEVMSTDELCLIKTARLTPRTELEKWVLNARYPEQTVTLGQALSNNVRAHLKQLFFKNKEIFSWTPADMTGFPCDIAQHCLNTMLGIKPMVQARRNLSPEKNRAMNEQVKELLDAGILREVKYQTWLANPVMVEKANGG